MLPPIVDLCWWREHQGSVALADVRWYLDGRSGLEAYRAGHLPGAVFVDLDRWLAAHGDPSRGRHPLPEPEVFAEGMRQLGIGDDSVVLAYDDQGGVIAARLVWMLRSTGHDAALLDGGMAAYDGPLETATPAVRRATFTVQPWPVDQLADIDDAAGAGAPIVLDARDPARYRGETEPVDPRAGHIPGARNLPTRGHLDESGRFLRVDALRARFAAVGVQLGDDVISYCGSGVTACHSLLALEHAGLGHGRLYPGSWSEYSAQPGREVETGEEHG